MKWTVCDLGGFDTLNSRIGGSEKSKPFQKSCNISPTIDYFHSWVGCLSVDIFGDFQPNINLHFSSHGVEIENLESVYNTMATLPSFNGVVNTFEIFYLYAMATRMKINVGLEVAKYIYG